jgi:peroxiredoxin
MTRSIAPIALLFVVLGAVAGLQYMGRSSRSGYEAPQFTLPDVHGQPHRLSDFRGRIVFLNLWATWCPPCRAEMPSMEALYRRLKDRDFAMLAVAEDEGGVGVVRPFVEEMKLTFPVLIDPQASLSPRYGATGYPETFIIDREGRVVSHTIGPEDWNTPEMLAYFDQLLSAPDAVQKAER